jgi:hypothetical protein
MHWRESQKLEQYSELSAATEKLFLFSGLPALSVRQWPAGMPSARSGPADILKNRTLFQISLYGARSG